jgi:C-terminal processing protease CtpA/Prc
MGFLSNADAVIIDLRKNPGGFINLHNFLASYFFGVEPVELLSRYHRDGNVTVKEWTLPKLPGKRMPRTDLYILTSKDTGSAGERFAFIMQQRKRAKIIGERTSGAGYGNKEFPIGDGFVFYVSIFRQFDSRTGNSWQETGVQPDISVSSERALSVAHLEAVRNLAVRAANERKKQQLNWLAPLLDFEMNGARQVSQQLLEKYAGNYTPQITVALEQEQLYFTGASGVKRRLFALADDYFLIEDASVPPENQARARFVRNAEGVVTELQLMVADGRSFPRPREGK